MTHNVTVNRCKVDGLCGRVVIHLPVATSSVSGGSRRENRYSRCRLYAQAASMGSLSKGLIPAPRRFVLPPVPGVPWYNTRPRNRSVFSLLPSIRQTLFVTRLTTCARRRSYPTRSSPWSRKMSDWQSKGCPVKAGHAAYDRSIRVCFAHVKMILGTAQLAAKHWIDCC